MNILPSGYDYRGNIFSQISFFWMDKLMWKGLRRTLKQDDLYPCPREQCSKYLFDKFEKNWQMELSNKNRKPDVKIALAKTVKSQFIIQGIFGLTESLLIFAVAVLSAEFASYFTNNQTNNSTTSLASSLAYTISISIVLIYHGFNRIVNDYHGHCRGIQIQTICNTALFKKILKLQQSTLHTVSIGHIINLMSTEKFKIQFGVSYWNYVWVAPVVIIVSIVLTLIWIGPIGLVGILYIILQTPAEIILGYTFAHFNHLKSLTGDKRIELMDQIIRGMRVIKFYVWENPCIASIRKIRKKEVRYAAKSAAAQSVCYTLYNISTFIAVFLTYITSIAVNNPLTSSQLAFVYILYTQLSVISILFFGKSIMKARQGVISLRRIQNVLELPETGESCLTHSPSNQNASIEIIDFSASWKGNEQINNNYLVLKQINLSVNTAKLVVITGRLGCGKSSLLMSLINELPGLSGQISLRGVISYTEQQPWIFSGTFRDNILFGRTLDPQRLQQVISACSLMDDIACFPDGDMTLIGERGVTLSGGQKARVALALAVYRVAEIYLLDDPLSAVDMKVGREIFDNCVRGFLGDKIVVLVTHQIQYVRQADWIVVMREGSVCYQGCYEDVLKDEYCQEFCVTWRR